ncbi:MAG: Asp/Glu racemase [Nocardioidaceae bacterium]|nr:Asp/Glu racemase [Nocardioidaceae bacterium]
MTVGAVLPPLEQRRIGVVVPYDMALDREMWRWAPYDVSLHFTRTPYLDLDVTLEMVESVGDLAIIRQCARDLCATEPEVYLYACTSGSFAGGLQHEAQITQALTRDDRPGITTSGALLQALRALDVSAIAVATPYTVEITERLVAFLDEAGLEVVEVAQLRRTRDIWKIPCAETRDLVRAADSPAADAVFVSCTNLPTYDVIEALEDDLGKPVLTANQVTMWAGLRELGLPAMAGGQRLVAATEEIM